jgi:hypothetical protein
MSEHLISLFGKFAQFTRDGLQYYQPEPLPPLIDFSRKFTSRSARRARKEIAWRKELWRGMCAEVASMVLTLPSPSLHHIFRGFALDSEAPDWSLWEHAWGASSSRGGLGRGGGSDKVDLGFDEEEDDYEDYFDDDDDSDQLYPPGSAPYSSLDEPATVPHPTTAPAKKTLARRGVAPAAKSCRRNGASGAASSRPTFASLEEGATYFVHSMLCYNREMSQEYDAHLRMMLVMHSWLSPAVLALFEPLKSYHAVVVANHNAYMMWRFVEFICTVWDLEGARPWDSIELRRRRAFSYSALKEPPRLVLEIPLLTLAPECNFDEWRSALTPVFETHFGEAASFLRTGTWKPGASRAENGVSVRPNTVIIISMLHCCSILTVRVLYQERMMVDVLGRMEPFLLWTLIGLVCRRITADLDAERRSSQPASEGTMLRFVRQVAYEEGIDVFGAAKAGVTPASSPFSGSSIIASKDSELGRALATRAQMYATVDHLGQTVDQEINLLYMTATDNNFDTIWRNQMAALLKKRFGANACFVDSGVKPVLSKKEGVTCNRKMIATIAYRMHPASVNFMIIDPKFLNALELEDAFELWQALQARSDSLTKAPSEPVKKASVLKSNSTATKPVVVTEDSSSTSALGLLGEGDMSRQESISMLVLTPFRVCNYHSWRAHMSTALKSAFPTYGSFVLTGLRYEAKDDADLEMQQQAEIRMFHAMEHCMFPDTLHLIRAHNLYDILVRKRLGAYGLWHLIDHIYSLVKRLNEVQCNPKEALSDRPMTTSQGFMEKIMIPQSVPVTMVGATVLELLQRYRVDANLPPDFASLLRAPGMSGDATTDLEELEAMMHDGAPSKRGGSGQAAPGGPGGKNKKAKKKAKAKRKSTPTNASIQMGIGAVADVISESSDSDGSLSGDEDGGVSCNTKVEWEPVSLPRNESSGTGTVDAAEEEATSRAVTAEGSVDVSPDASILLLLRLQSSASSSSDNYPEWRRQMEMRLMRGFGPSANFIATNQRCMTSDESRSMFEVMLSYVHPSTIQELRGGGGGDLGRLFAHIESQRDSYALWRLLELEHFNSMFRMAAEGAGDAPEEVASQCVEHYIAFEKDILLLEEVSAPSQPTASAPTADLVDQKDRETKAAEDDDEGLPELVGAPALTSHAVLRPTDTVQQISSPAAAAAAAPPHSCSDSLNAATFASVPQGLSVDTSDHMYQHHNIHYEHQHQVQLQQQQLKFNPWGIPTVSHVSTSAVGTAKPPPPGFVEYSEGTPRGLGWQALGSSSSLIAMQPFNHSSPSFSAFSPSQGMGSGSSASLAPPAQCLARVPSSWVDAGAGDGDGVLLEEEGLWEEKAEEEDDGQLVHALSRLLMDEPRPAEPSRRQSSPDAIAAAAGTSLSGFHPMDWQVQLHHHDSFLTLGSSATVLPSSDASTTASHPDFSAPVDVTAWLPRSASTATHHPSTSNPTASAGGTHNTQGGSLADASWMHHVACFLCSDLGVCGAETQHAPELCPRRALLRRMAALESGARTAKDETDLCAHKTC